MTAKNSFHVFATRPEQQNTLWAQRLLDEGFHVSSAPLLAINPVFTPEQKSVIRATIQNLDQFQKLIFVSQNAVHYAFQWIDEFWPQFPIGLTCYGVGNKTYRAIKEQLNDYHVAIEYACQAMTSEELLQLPSLQNVKDQKILIFRGIGGRTKIQNELSSRGATVKNCELYIREVRQPNLNMTSGWSQTIVPVFSGETLNAFVDCIKQQNLSFNCYVVVPGKRVSVLAEQHGFNRIVEAENASEEKMLQAIKSII